jgi:hypothetical protein
MFSELAASVVSTPALRKFLDVLCKGTCGAAAADIPAAYMVRAFAEMYQPGELSSAATATASAATAAAVMATATIVLLQPQQCYYSHIILLQQQGMLYAATLAATDS